MARGSAGTEHVSLAAMYLDTEDRRLAKEGIAWRLRREGRRWVQTLKAAGAHALERFEHEVIRPNATHDAAAHAGTAVGERLLAVLSRARADDMEVGVRYTTEVRRSLRKVRSRGAIVEVSFDEGRLLANGSSLPIREVEFELVSGSAAAMVALAERWRKRFGLVYDPRTKAERGDRFAAGEQFPPVRKASRPEYSREATAMTAFGAVLDECLAHITRNAIGLCEGDPSSRVEHVHQLRVGIRRLRSGLRSFEGWTPQPAAELIDELRALFAALGECRDNDVLNSGVFAELAKSGAPPLQMPSQGDGSDPADAVRANDTQRLFLAWIAWRTTLAEQPTVTPAPSDEQHDEQNEEADPADNGQDEACTDARTFHRNVERRLRRWHRRIVADWKAFDELDETALHALRKRIKRQRYAVEFFGPVLRRRSVERYLKPLATIQDSMGQLNDLFVARVRYQALVETNPAAWFALGWITARIAEVRAHARPELGRLAEADPPTI